MLSLAFEADWERLYGRASFKKQLLRLGLGNKKGKEMIAFMHAEMRAAYQVTHSRRGHALTPRGNTLSEVRCAPPTSEGCRQSPATHPHSFSRRGARLL